MKTILSIILALFAVFILMFEKQFSGIVFFICKGILGIYIGFGAGAIADMITKKVK